MRKTTHSLTRRKFMGTTAAAGAAVASGIPIGAMAQGGSWSMRPDAKVKELSLVVWSYGNVYDQIKAGFEKEWDVPIDLIASPYPQHEAKLATVYAGGDYVDVGVSASTSFAEKIAQGLVRPLDDLPGIDAYKADLTNRATRSCSHDGKLYALPYFSGVLIWGYNDLMREKAGIDAPFSSYDEFIEQSVKAKADGIAEYPVLWTMSSNGMTQTWFSIVHDQGGSIFGADGSLDLEDGSKGRDVLRWLGNTFTESNIADPESLKVGTGQASRAFGGGSNLYRGPDHHYMMNHINIPDRTAIAGHFKALRHPESGKSLTLTQPYFISTATRNVEWAWTLLQYLGGKTPDGEYRQAINLGKNAMLGSGYKPVMENQDMLAAWKQWSDDPSIITGAFETAADLNEVMPLDQAWFEDWRKQSSIEAQKVCLGEQSADVACDNMIATHKRLSKA